MLDYIDHIVTDEQKELYRFAAKAAGYDITFAISHANLLAGYTALIKTSNSEWRDWHPRENPTDALLLAAALKLHIIHNDPDDQVLWVAAGINQQDHWASSKFTDESLRPQNICRAIFFAAVSAGTEQELPSEKKTMPTPAFNSEKFSAAVFARGQRLGLYDIPKAIANRFCQQQRRQGVKMDWQKVGRGVYIKVIIDTATNVQALATAARRLELACKLVSHNLINNNPNAFVLADCQLADCRGYSFDIERESELDDWYIRVGPPNEPNGLYNGYAGLEIGAPLEFAIAEALDGADIF